MCRGRDHTLRNLANQKSIEIQSTQVMRDETIGDFKQGAAAWMLVTQANPNTAAYFEFLARDAYLAKQTRVGDLAAQRVLNLVPKSQQKQLKQQLQQFKSRAAASGSAAGSSATGG